MTVQWMDCTLRDGANVVGKGFDAGMTRLILEGLTKVRAPYIEMGNAMGVGAYDLNPGMQALPDGEYFRLAEEFSGRGSEIGMFFNAGRGREKDAEAAAASGLSFLRIGTEAGNGRAAEASVGIVKKHGLKAFYSLMKAYLLTPQELAEEGKRLEAAGLDEITIMDSAGTLTPDRTAEYTRRLAEAVSIPVGFHGHNNLGLSAANALAAWQNGARILDCSLMGMARSAGNVPSEVCIALMQREGQMTEIPLYDLLHWIEDTLQPAMEERGYHNPLPPLELVLGMAGCHSGNLKLLREVARERGVDLMRLIVKASEISRRTLTREEIESAAGLL